MPRPKKPPAEQKYLESYIDEGGELVDIIQYLTDEFHTEGSGCQQKNKGERRYFEALKIVVEDFLLPGESQAFDKDYLRTPSAFAREMQARMETLDENISNTSSLRESIYPRLMKEYEFLSKYSKKVRFKRKSE